MCLIFHSIVNSVSIRRSIAGRGFESNLSNATLPAKAHALLTILEPNGNPPGPATAPAGAGLRRFLSTPDFVLTSE
ncbi:MAG: hypothetical protein AB9869_11245 [Verrucomicrobiia bacterium]